MWHFLTQIIFLEKHLICWCMIWKMHKFYEHHWCHEYVYSKLYHLFKQQVRYPVLLQSSQNLHKDHQIHFQLILCIYNGEIILIIIIFYSISLIPSNTFLIVISHQRTKQRLWWTVLFYIRITNCYTYFNIMYARWIQLI